MRAGLRDQPQRKYGACHGQRTILLAIGANGKLTFYDFSGSMKAYAQRSRAISSMGYLQGLLAPRQVIASCFETCATCPADSALYESSPGPLLRRSRLS